MRILLSKHIPKILLLTVTVLLGCNSSNEDKSTKDTAEVNESNTSKTVTALSAKDQYVADANEFVATLIKIVESVNDPASEKEALEKMRKLKPKAAEMSETAKKLIGKVWEDPPKRDELIQYFQAGCPSDADLKPLIAKLGGSIEESKYPDLLKAAGELVKTSMHDRF